MSARTELRFFPVEAVKPATLPLEEVSFAEGIHQTIGYADLVREREFVVAFRAETLSYYENLAGLRPAGPVEACSRYGGKLVREAPNHALVAALECAFRDHRPVVLSPDVIWLTICQGLACHIRENGDELRDRFVTHADKMTLEVRRDDLIPGSPEDPWGEVVVNLSEKICEHLGASHGLFVADFSTTGAAERVASEIVLLDAMQGYFEYEVMTFICGIPAIALDGTPEDWERIEARVDAFARLNLDLDWWLTPLRPILRQFTAASRGEVDARFWQSIFRIYHPGRMCYPHSMFGWVAILFPYLRNHGKRTSDRNPWLASAKDLERMLDARHAGEHRAPGPRALDATEDGLFPRQLPTGMSSVPFRWKLFDPAGNPLETRSMELLGGFVGVAQDRKTLALRPEIGWAVREGVAP